MPTASTTGLGVVRWALDRTASRAHTGRIGREDTGPRQNNNHQKRGAMSGADGVTGEQRRADSVTEVIAAAGSNVPGAVNRLFDLLYRDLYRVARNRVRQDGNELDLSATSLVHDTYERLVQLNELKVSDRQQFFTYAATVMRSVVVDLARARLAERRGGGVAALPLDTVLSNLVATPLDESVVRLNDALSHLEAVEPRLARVVEMRYFAGMTQEETAETLGVTVRTVTRDWTKAKSLLAAILST